MNTAQKIRAFTEEVEHNNPGWIRGRREAYLRRAIWLFGIDVKATELLYGEIQEAGIPLYYRQRMLEVEDYDLLKNRLKRLKRELADMRAGEIRHRITDHEIQAAREYPITDLIEFKRRKCRCINPAHDDKRPSMSYKRNRVKCFSCQWTGDSIDVVMLQENLTFIEAVRRLNNV